MLRFFQSSGLAVLACLLSENVYATSSISDGELVVTLRKGQPCYSYPTDEITKKKSFYLGMLAVTNIGQMQSPFVMWELESGKDEYSPSSPGLCLEYSILKINAIQKTPAKLHQYNIPYEARLKIFSGNNERRYRAFYCLGKDLTGTTILLKANFNEQRNRFECIKRANLNDAKNVRAARINAQSKK